MTLLTDKQKARLKELHDREDQVNQAIGSIDKQMRHLTRLKNKLSKEVSKNMLLRNKIINQQQ